MLNMSKISNYYGFQKLCSLKWIKLKQFRKFWCVFVMITWNWYNASNQMMKVFQSIDFWNFALTISISHKYTCEKKCPISSHSVHIHAIINIRSFTLLLLRWCKRFQCQLLYNVRREKFEILIACAILGFKRT